MKVLVSDPLAPSAVEQMKRAGLEVIVKTGLQGEALQAAVSDVDVVAVRSGTKITADVIASAKKLKLIVRAGVGLDNVDAEAASKKNIRIENTPHATTVTVAEHTLALMLALARNVPQSYASLRSGEWNRKAFEGMELKDKVLSVVGFGRIGQEVAKRAKAFGMQVIANDRAADFEVMEALDVAHFPLEKILERADFVTLHLPLSEENYHLFGKALLMKMKKGSYLINASRGGIVDEEALCEVLKSGHLAGCAIDVFEKEPPAKDHPLLKMPQVIAVPHLGASTREGQDRAGQEVARIVIAFAKNHG